MPRRPTPKIRRPTPSVPFLLTLFTLTASAAAVKRHPRYDGKSQVHQAAHAGEIRLQPRQQGEGLSLIQDFPIASAAGPAVAASAPPIAAPSVAAPAEPVPMNGAAPGISAALFAASGQAVPPEPTAGDDAASTVLPSMEASIIPILAPAPSLPGSSVSDAFPNPFTGFPSTTIQVPIATVCPDTPPTSAPFSILPTPGLGDASTGLINVTAVLPNGNSTVFLTTTTLPILSTRPDFPASGTPIPQPNPINVAYPNATSIPTAVFGNDGTAALPTGALPLDIADQQRLARGGAPTARILLDDTGCQTLYSPIVTALCRTTVRLIGIPDATVTDCDQYVTFSSETAGCGGELVAGSMVENMPPVVTGTETGVGGLSTMGPVVAGALTGAPSVLPITNLDTPETGVGAAPAVTPPPPAAGAAVPSPAQLNAPVKIIKPAGQPRGEVEARMVTEPYPTPTVSNGLPDIYYAAPWYSLIHGGVPRDVRVETCSAMSGPYPGDWVSCITNSESWTVATAVKTTSKISVASFSGPAILTAGTYTLTTTLSFEKTLTLPTTTTSQTVVREGMMTIMNEGEDVTTTVQQTATTKVELVDVPGATETGAGVQGIAMGEPNPGALEGVDGEESTLVSQVWVTVTKETISVETVTKTLGT